MLELKEIETWISTDHSKKIQYVLLFFIFIIGLSYNMFQNLFGCSLQKVFRNTYTRHVIALFFLYLLLDTNLDSKKTSIHPFLSFLLSCIIYVLGFILLHSNHFYILFIIGLTGFLFFINKYKKYVELSIQDQEIKQERINFIHKTNNVTIIMMILTITIGSLTSFDYLGHSCKRV
jgi:hypothetical protein